MGHGVLNGAALAALAGDAAAHDLAPDGVPRVAPASPGGVARVLREASARAWSVRIEHDSWSPADTPADLALSTVRLTALTNVSSIDQVATAGAGCAVEALHAGVGWCAVDPPGRGRTVGGVLAHATSGPLRTGYGPLRDQILGLTAVTGDGRLITTGGRVLKNVAGYDLAKLVIGGCDAFGVIVSAHVRLRAPPRADHTALVRGPRSGLLTAARDLLERGLPPVAVELTGTRGAWTLAIRRHDGRGTDGGTPAGEDYWRDIAYAPPGPVTFRLGTVPDGTGRALDLLEDMLPVAHWVSASPAVGAVRWSGDATAEQLVTVRQQAAQHEMPVTLERVAWPVREVVGMHGAYRPGVGPLVHALRRALDPAGVLVA